MIFAQSLGIEPTLQPEAPTSADARARAWELLTTQAATAAILAPTVSPTAPTPTPMPPSITTTTTKPKTNIKTWLIIGGGVTAALGILVFLARR